MRRTLLLGALLTSLGVGPVPASAQPYFELLWSATSGAGVPGSDEIGAKPGDGVTVDIRVQVDAEGLLFAGISLDFTTEALTNPVIHPCPTGCQGMNPFPATVLPGSIRHIRVFDPPIPGPTTLLLAQIDFTATGAPGSIDPFFVFEVDGTLTASGEADLSPPANSVQVVSLASVPVLPGPVAAIPLALALLASAGVALRGPRSGR